MNKIILITLCLPLLLLLSCEQQKESEGDKTIDLASAMSNIGIIKASDCFEEIEYIPLETTDSCLIGRGANVQLIQDKLLITTSQKQCFLFERKNGKFIRSIGHVGNNPGGYSSVDCWVDEPSGLIYFPGWNGQLVCYNVDGSYVGNIKIPGESSGWSMTNYNYLAGDTLIGFYHNITGNEKRRILFFNKNGEEIITLPNEQSAPAFEINQLSVLNSELAQNLFGAFGGNTILLTEAKDTDIASVIVLGNSQFWHLGNHTYFKEVYNDTIYRIEGTGLLPDRVIHLGDLHWEYAERYAKTQDKNIFISQVLENEHCLLLRFITRMFGNENKNIYNAVYNKQSKKLLVSELKEGIVDDLTHFIPLQPAGVSARGEFCSIIPAESISEWFDTNPDDSNKQIRMIKNVREDDNPVVVLMR